MLIISIHAPRVGERQLRLRLRKLGVRFQSTLPVWGSDAETTAATAAGIYFNPRSPCGGATCGSGRGHRQLPTFQSTLPVWGSDPKNIESLNAQQKFQSTLPVWGSDICSS